jgi:hypothetical protein
MNEREENILWRRRNHLLCIIKRTQWRLVDLRGVERVELDRGVRLEDVAHELLVVLQVACTQRTGEYGKEMKEEER